MNVPKNIVHVGKTKERSEMLEDILAKFSEAFGLTENETSLLRVYCMCSNGFKPSSKYLEDKTGLPKRTVLYIRAELTERRIIEQNDESIFVRWDDYCAMCMVDPKKLTLKKGIRERRKLKLETLKTRMPDVLSDNDVYALYQDWNKLIEFYTGLPDKEVSRFTGRLKKLIKNPKPDELEPSQIKDRKFDASGIDFTPLGIGIELPF